MHALNSLHPRTRHVLALATLALALIGGAWYRLQLPQASRAIEPDELLSARFYTWVGMDPAGELRPIDRIGKLHDAPAPSLKQLALGFYAAVGRWPEPNNHIVNSVAMNAAYAIAGTTERSGRLGAMLGAMVYVLAVFWLARRVLDLGGLAYVVAAWAWCAPYVFRFSLTARGYSWMLALGVLLILATRWAYARPQSVLRHAVMAALAILSIVNIISMSTDWVAPLYATVFLLGAGPLPDDTDRTQHLREWRRSLLLQATVVVAVVGAYFLPHLPFVYSAAGQYGLFPREGHGLWSILAEIVRYDFPSPGWLTVAALGLSGAAAAVATSGTRWLGTFALLTIGSNLANYCASGRFPYERATGHWVSLAILGLSLLVRMAHAPGTSFHRRATVAASVLLTGLLVGTTPVPRLGHPMLQQLLDAAAAIDDPAPGRVTYFPRPSDDTVAMALYAPPSVTIVDKLTPNQSVRMLYFSRGRSTGSPALKQHFGRTVPMEADATVTPGSFIAWYFDLRSMGTAFTGPFQFLEERGVSHWPQYRRVQLKFTVFGAHDGAIWAVDPTNYAAQRQIVLDGIQRFGGDGVLFIADRVSEHPVNP